MFNTNKLIIGIGIFVVNPLISTASEIVWFQEPSDFYSWSSTLNTDTGRNSQVADDFVTPNGPNGEAAWLITEVAWQGRYVFGIPQNGYDFNLFIYADNGTGMSPTGGPGDPSSTALHAESFTSDEVLVPPPGPIVSNWKDYQATLDTPFLAQAGQKYWLAVQAIADESPRWEWRLNKEPQIEHSVMIGLLGLSHGNLPYWHHLDPIHIAGPPWNAVFEVRGVPVPEPGTLLMLLLGGGLMATRSRNRARRARMLRQK